MRGMGYSAWCVQRAEKAHEACSSKHCVCWCHWGTPVGRFAKAATDRRTLRRIRDAEEHKTQENQQ